MTKYPHNKPFETDGFSRLCSFTRGSTAAFILRAFANRDLKSSRLAGGAIS